MAQTHLAYPKRQSIALSKTMFRLYHKAIESQDDEILFDLSRTESLTPFGIIMLTVTIRECQRRQKKCKYQRPKNRRLLRFMKEIGFDNFFKLGETSVEPEDKISHQRIQLRRMDGASLDIMFFENLTEIFSENLNISEGVKGFIKMSLIETMTNVVDHSKSGHYYMCALNYPQKKQIRLCIADLGIGIPTSLRRSPKYKRIKNDYEAIKKATDEGISTRPGQAGLGLNHIREFLFVNKGQMCIISGRGKVYWKFGRREILEQKMDAPFSGTIIKWVVNTDKKWRYFMSDEDENFL